MSTETLRDIAQYGEPEPRRPLNLGRRNDPAIDYLANRLTPKAIPDGGVAPLDIAAFTSSV